MLSEIVKLLLVTQALNLSALKIYTHASRKIHKRYSASLTIWKMKSYQLRQFTIFLGVNQTIRELGGVHNFNSLKSQYKIYP